jgi:hypothetical protein
MDLYAHQNQSNTVADKNIFHKEKQKVYKHYTFMGDKRGGIINIYNEYVLY